MKAVLSIEQEYETAMKMRSTHVRAALALGTVALMAPATGQTQAQLDVAYAPASFNDTYEDLAARFAQENPGVTVNLISAENYDALAQLLLRNAVTDSLPDVAHQGLGLLRTFADNGMAVPLGPFIASESDWRDQGYTESVEETCTITDQVYCLPFAISFPVLFYNRDLVEAAGGNPDEFPMTWDDIIALAEDINQLGAEVSGIYYTVDGNGTYPFQILLATAGGAFMSPSEDTFTFDGAEGQFVLDMMERFRDAGMIDMTKSQARQMFAAGGLGIFIINSSNYGRLSTQAAGSFEIGMAPLPHVSMDGSRVPVGGNAVVMLAEEEEERHLAWEWIKFATGPIGQTILVSQTGYVPVNTIAASTPELLGDFYRDNPHHQVAADELNRATVYYNFPGPNSIRVRGTVEDVMLDVLRGDDNPEDALRRMHEEVSALIDN